MASVDPRHQKTTPAAGGRGDDPPSRVIIEGVTPEIDAGAFEIKRTLGEHVVVEADIFAEGHDILRAALLFRHRGERDWRECRMIPLGNDRWRGRFTVEKLGHAEYTIEAWVDRFASWHHEVQRKHEAGQPLTSELLEGAQLVAAAADRSSDPADAEWLRNRASLLGDPAQNDRPAAALDHQLELCMDRHPDRAGKAQYTRVLSVRVEPVRAAFGAWYELFPRSASSIPGRHGTFQDVEARLPYIAEMGFDVLYLPPIHPIGTSYRKGPNNTLDAGPRDPGSPWAIGAPEGGHKAVLSDLGTIDEFDHLVAAAAQRGIQVALDIAFQCSPDHPYVLDHPEWFRHRPDGTIKYAENPPKKYQDIYPLDFEGPAWRSLWEELRDVFLFWVEHGVTIFRVDNPHTKPFRFWDWCIAQVWEKHPETIFLSEAFTRPRLMKRLAKGGFTQSYSYFTWRNNKQELAEYFTELTTTECVEYMRPNLFANTPDILHEYLQVGGPAAFKIRLVLAATLGTSYGIYGPPFEHCVGTPLRPGSEEYLDSEKYQIRYWDLDRPISIRDFITRINSIRRENPALQQFRDLRFFPIDNPSLLAYGKASADHENLILVVVNLDPAHTHTGWLELPLNERELAGDAGQAFQVHDLISDARYLWNGSFNFIRLDPGVCPAHIFQVKRKIRTERDFDYYQ